MSHTLIGVGGTGAKVLEAFVFLSFLGVPNELNIPSEIHLRMVDTDAKGGNLKRLKNLLDILHGENGVYSKITDSFTKTKQWIPADLHYERQNVADTTQNFNFHWNIDLTEIKNLDTMIGSTDIGGESSYLRAVYSEKDQEIPLEEGCHARPRLGALIYDYFFRNDTSIETIAKRKSFWNSVQTPISTSITSGKAKIMFTGSLFGGTGASGVPTLVKCFRDKYLQNTTSNSIGMTFMLPYFTYAPNPDCPANPDEFALNSKIALRYYRNSDFLSNINNVNPAFYLVGQQPNIMKLEDGSNANSSKANDEQCNPAIPAELIGAFSVMHYFHCAIDGNDGVRVNTVESGSDNIINMENMPNIKFEYDVPKRFGNKTEKATKTVYLKTAMQRLKMFALLWKLLKKQTPFPGTKIFAYHSLTNMLKENGIKWETTAELQQVDGFADAAYIWLYQLEMNGFQNLEIKKFDAIVKILDSNTDQNIININDKNAEELYIEINKATSNFRNIKSDYIKLFYAVMKVCCDNYPY